MGVKKNNPKKQLEAELKKQLNSKTKNQLDYEIELKKLKSRIKRAEKVGYLFPENIIPEKPTRVYKKDIQQLSKLKGDTLRAKADFFVDKRTAEAFTGSEGVKIQHHRASIKAKQTKEINQYTKDYNKFRNDTLAPDESDNFTKKFEKLPEEIKSKILKKWWEELPDEEKNIIEQDLANERQYDRTVPEPEPIDQWEDDFMPSEVDNVLANIEEQLNRWSPSPNWTPTLAGVKENDKNIVQSMYEGALSEYGREGLAQILQGKASQINSLLGEILYASGDKEGNFKDGNTRVNFDINLFASLLNDKPLSIHQSERLTDLAESMELNN